MEGIITLDLRLLLHRVCLSGLLAVCLFIGVRWNGMRPCLLRFPSPLFRGQWVLRVFVVLWGFVIENSSYQFVGKKYKTALVHCAGR